MPPTCSHRRGPDAAGAAGPASPGAPPARTTWVVGGRAVLAGLCIAASVPPWGWWPLAFVGIALLDRLIAGHGWRRRFRRTWLVAFAWLVPGLLWMWDFTAPGYVRGLRHLRRLLRAWPPPCARRVGPAGSPCPALFTLAEMARWRFPFGGEPLATLAMSQADAPLGQTARLAGSYLARGAGGARRRGPVGGLGAARVGRRRHRGRRWWRPSALAAVAPQGHVIGHLRVAVVQGGGPQHTRAADTDNWVVFQREVQGHRDHQGTGRPGAVARGRGRPGGHPRRRTPTTATRSCAWPASCTPPWWSA